ncbi:nonribosomal peptide synthetase [Histoplasma capsulatum var. duboisii H88]|uniref:Nonribosomal peptide synthetase sidC n=1 Tax=Ajellomyces capsulatus (strain H88) TaxID=544711 RepID=F0U9E8_AJEC8|nr:nonribosomal peptide synthetase [Histoplasma capsulatum var. duboisii H88]
MDRTLGRRYTTFPDLDYGQEEVPRSITIAWRVERCQLVVDVLILSWASLLKSVTGHECPTFCFDGQPIEADLNTATFQTLTSPSTWMQIAVTYDPKQSGGHIISTGCTSARYLTQIARQLTSIICNRLKCQLKDQSSDDGPYLSILNPTPEFIPGPSLLHDLVRSEGCGNDLAIDFLNGNKTRSTLSYELLHLNSTALTVRLTDALESLTGSCKRNPVIPVLLPQSIELYIAWLSILKAGAAVCPLNLDAPPERIKYIANDVGADIIVTTRSLASRLEHLDRHIQTIITEDVDIEAKNIDRFQAPQIDADDMAYVEYTSGSTGLPKGVAVSHRAATQSLLAHDKWIPPFKRFLQFASPTFDVSIFEIIFPLFRGATLVGCDRNLMLGDLPRIITELDVDGAELTPTVAGELLQRRSAAPCLKVLLTIGEMLTRKVVDEFGSSPNNDGILYAMYGPTEAAIHCTLAPNISAESRVGNIGVPLQTVSTFIVSPQFPDSNHSDEPEILPIGHIGELAIGGPQLAECYINREEETKKAFLVTGRYGRIYRTGDMARLHPSGEMECLGRISTGQVKLRGQRVELGEIERIIYKVPGIRSAVVNVLENTLVAFVSVDETFPGITNIIQVCRKWLPKFMIPGDVELLDNLPRLPSGKIDNAGLERGYSERRNLQRTDTTGFDDQMQRKIASCVEDVLNLSVGKSTSLTQAGLDSLKAIKLASVLRNAGINIDVLGILEADSIPGIAARSHESNADALTITGKFESDNWKCVVNATFDSLKLNGYLTDFVDVVPCSPVQMAMLSETMRDPKAYLNWIELQFHESIRINDVKHAFYEIGLKNEILRSSFIPTDYPNHSHVQVIWNKLGGDKVQEVSELKHDSSSHEYPLLNPFYVELTEIDDRIHALVHIHHAVYDGWSWDQILSDIEHLLYSRTLNSRPQYRLVTDYYLNHISTEDRESAINYWQEQMEGIKPTTWPNFQDTSDIPVGLRTIQRFLGIEVQNLDATVQHLRVSRQAIFQAAFSYLLSSYTGDSDTVFGSVASGRMLPIAGIEDIIGPCMVTNPLRINLDQLRTVRDLIGAIHNLNRNSLKHGFLPLIDIKRGSGIDSGVPLFDSIFVWQETLSGEKARSELIREVKSRDFLEFNMSLELTIEGDSTLSIENADYIKQTALPGLADGVEKLAKSDPERVAIEFLDAFDPALGTASITKLTYRGMDIRSNQLANYLLSHGLFPNSLVSIFLEKSIDLYIAIIAVIKAGCGYVPITPQTPVNRINTIIEEAKCSICITNSPLSLKLREIRGTEIVALDTITLHDFPATPSEVPISDSSVAYCTFTSGSTGKPKGVLITHRNLQSNIAVLSEIYPTHPGSKFLQACSHAFDVTAGEAVNEKVFKSWAGRGIYQGYGPSETTNICTVRPNLKPADFINHIGSPFKNTSAFVISGEEGFSLLPRGAVGEFCFGGDQVGAGYLNMPALTCSKFICHPQYGKVYKSGDFGRMLPDGSLAFTGRRDDQVKLRGLRIELGEINRVILEDPEVIDCTTFITTDALNKQQQLVCFWVPALSHGDKFTARENRYKILKLFDLIRARLPEYMIPSMLIPIRRVPITTSGKTDKLELLKHFRTLNLETLQLCSCVTEALSDKREFSDTEMRVAEAVAKVALVSQADIGLHTSFYSLGLNSISAISLSRHLKLNGFGQVDVSVIMKYNTVYRLSRNIERSGSQLTKKKCLPNIGSLFSREFVEELRKNAEGSGCLIRKILPCTPLQEAMLLRKYIGNSTAYYNHLLFEVRDVGKLRNAWVSMVQRHDILRSYFASTGQSRFSFAQIVLESVNLPWNEISTTIKELDSHIEEQKRELAKGKENTLPYLLTVLRIAESGKTLFLFIIHHALYDGEAMSLLLQEVELDVSGKPLPQIVPFDLYLEQMVAVDIEEADQFWQPPLSDFTPSHLLDAQNRANRSTSRTFQTVEDDFGTPLSKVMGTCKDLSVTLLTLVQAAWSKLLLLYTQKPDICFGNVFSCRSIPVDGAERIIGPCLNTLPIRIKANSNTMNIGLAKHLQEYNSAVMPYQLTSLRHLQSKFGHNNSHLFDTLVILQKSIHRLDDKIWELVEEKGDMDFPLVCEVVPNDEADTLRLIIYYDDAQFGLEDTKIMLRSFSASLQNVLLYPSGRAMDSSILDPGLPSFVDELRRHLTPAAEAGRPSWGEGEKLSLCSGKSSLQIRLVQEVLSTLSNIAHTHIKPHTTIFQLGLDSINAVQISARFKALGYEITASDVLENPSVGELASLLVREKKVNDSRLLSFDFMSFQARHWQTVCQQIDVPEKFIESIRPCTPAQSGMLALFTNSEGELYFNHIILESNISLDLQTLKAAWTALTEIHDILRTGFTSIRDEEAPFAAITYRMIPILPVQDYIISASNQVYNDLECETFWKEFGKDVCITKFPDMGPLHQEKRVGVVIKSCSKTLQSLQEGCRNAGVTLQAAGQVAWARILASYTGESRVTFGLVLSGRNTFEDAEKAVFPCLTTVPSSYIIEGSNRNLLERVMKLDVSLVKYQFTPLSKIHQPVGSGSSLFDTIFVFQKHTTTFQNDIWKVYDEDARTNYPVSIELILRDGKLEFQLTFETDILPEPQAEILLRQLDDLLIDTLSYLDSPCDCFTNGENKDILSAVAAKEARISSPVKLVHQFVELQAQESPSKIALEFASKIPGKQGLSKRKWTYKEFNEVSNKYARLLQRNGASPGNLIGICFDKCPEAYFAILAILKVGCAYVALDPGAPEARKKFILNDSGAKILLSTTSMKNELKGLPVLILDSPGILDGIPSLPPVLEEEIQPEDCCYCLYTSGTTGTPKGCEITHDNVVQAMLSFQRLFHGHWDETSRWLQFAAFHFDVSVLEQYWSWSVGICVTACPRDTIFADLPGTIRELEITHIDLTPSLARLLDPEETPSLRRGVFITGGEQLKQEILEAWGEYGVIYNGYGPTEVTIGCTMLPRVPRNGKPSNIGPQFDNVGSVVCKPGTTTPVLRGGVGELCVTGTLVGRGYLNRPQLTEEKFQYVKEMGERIYRTGDLVRLLHDGSFCFLGRIDDQVKLRGQRLEIGEINQVISNSAEEVGEVVTMVLKQTSRSKEQLVSFFTTNTPKNPDALTCRIDFDPGMNKILSEINQACHKTLPGFMIPTHILPVTAFPLNANNKIDQRHLKKIYEDMTLEEMQRLSSQTRIDSQTLSKDVCAIIALVSKVTGVEVSAISPWSSIFELGLDSISAISFSRVLRDSGFKEAQPSLLMKNSTIMTLSNALKRSAANELTRKALYQESRQRITAFAHRNLTIAARKLGTPLASIEAVAPCTSLQEGMIYRFIESQKPVYFTNFNFELSSNVNVSHLKTAWLKAQSSVQILRTKFPLTAGHYFQVILKEDYFPWFELTAISDVEVGSIANCRYKEWCSEPANLTGRVWEAGVVIGPGTRWMCLNIFHGLYDGNSLPLLLNIVIQAYIDHTSAPETPSYIECLARGPLCKIPGAKEFWLKHLDGPPKPLPFISDAHEGDPLVTILGIGKLEKLEPLRRKLDVLEQSVLLACWLRVLERHFKFIPIVGVIVSGRAHDIKDTEDVVGPMFNTLPCNISCSKIFSMADLVRCCHEYYISTLQYQHTSLRDIMKWLQRRSGIPLFDHLFVFQREPNEKVDSAGSLWSPIISQSEPDYPAAFEVQRDRDGSLTVTLVTQASSFTTEAAQQLTLQFRDTLVDFLDNPSSKLNLATQGSDNSKIGSAGVDNIQPHTNGYTSNFTLLPFEWTAMASRLREEIASIANIDALAIQENTSIFEVGLDSIDAIQLSSRLANAGIRVTVTAIMRGQTIKNILHDIESNEPNGKVKPQASLEVLEQELRNYFENDRFDLAQIERIFPATPLQEAMVAEMVASDFNRYFNHDILEIKDNVDIDKLKRAWEQVVDANAIFRTSFAEVSDPRFPFTYAQLIHHPGKPIDWSVVDTIGRSVDTILEEERRKATAIFQAGKPLFKVQLLGSVNEGQKRHLLLSMPHAMYDGWSLDLLNEDIATCYSGQRPNIRGSCDKALSHILNSTRNELGLQSWKGTLGGACPTAFPKQINAGGDYSNVHHKEKALDIPITDVNSFCKNQGITLQTLSLTCWALVLSGYLGKLDVVFGTILAGRDIPDTNAEQLMFPLMNSVAIRIVLHGSRSDMLKYVQETLVPVSEHQYIPLRTAKQVAGFGGQSLFDTLFIFQKRPRQDSCLQELLYKSIGGFSDVEYPVRVEMEELKNSIVWRVACRDTVLGELDASRLLDRLNFVFESITKYPDSETIDFSDDGISICQSPVFQEQERVKRITLLMKLRQPPFDLLR